MSGPKITVEMGIEESKLFFGLQRIIGAQDQMTDGLGKTTREAKRAAQEEAKAAKEMDRFVESTKRLTATPLERYNAQMERLNKAHKAGKLTQEEVTRATKLYQKELDDATTVTAELVNQSDELGKETKKTFGSSALAMLTSYAGGFLSITGAVGILKEAFQQLREERDKALASSTAMSDPNRDLAQLANSPEEYSALLERRDELARKYGIQRDVATEVLFSSQSAGLSDEQTEVAAKSGLLTDPRATTLLMGKVKETFGDQIAPEQALNVSIKAAADSPLNINDMTDRMPEALNPAKELGLSYEETAAFIAKMSPHFASGSQTIDRFTGLAGKMALFDDFKGQGMAGFEKLLAMSDEERQEILGTDKEKNEAFRAIRDELTRVKEYSQELRGTSAQTGTEQDALDRQVSIRLSDEGERAKFRLRQQETQEEVTREDTFATQEAELKNAISRERERLNKEGVGVLSRFSANTSLKVAETLGVSPNQAKAAGYFGEAIGPGIPILREARAFGKYYRRIFGGEDAETETEQEPLPTTPTRDSLRKPRDRASNEEATRLMHRQTELLSSMDDKLGTLNINVGGGASRNRSAAAAAAATSERR